MGTRDPRIDAYIARAQPFAKPILKRLRALAHATVPTLNETVKWGFPHFDYRGEMMCSMAAFKQHVAFGFWKAPLMKAAKTLKRGQAEGMGHLGRIASEQDLPPDKVLRGWIAEAAKLNDAGTRVARPPPKKKAAIKVPPDVTRALKANQKAQATWAAFPPSHRREYLEWIVGAKSEATRLRRLATTLENLSAGRSLNWKYQR